MLEAQKIFINEAKTLIIESYKNLKGQDIVIFGAGTYGRMMIDTFKDSELYNCVVAFCDNDNDKIGMKIEGITIESLDVLEKKYPNAVYIVASNFRDEISEKLKKRKINYYCSSSFVYHLELQMGFYYSNKPDDWVAYAYKWIAMYERMSREGGLNKYIDDVLKILQDEQSKKVLSEKMLFFKTGHISHIDAIPYDKTPYFDESFLPFSTNEVMYDCGAYIGDTLADFLAFTGGRYKRIISFEPDYVNFIKLKKFVEDKKMHDVSLVKAATGSDNGMISFSENGSGASRIDKQGTGKVEMIKLDNYIKEQPTIIKMDLEGAEMDTLKGAEKTIKTLKPKLAICVYHKLMDFYDIPMYLHKLVPEYKFRLRHHTKGLYDTVLYAWINE